MQLYALCDQDLLDRRGIDLKIFIDICKKHDAKIIQYRNKSSDIAILKTQLIKIRQLYDGFLIINDAYELIDYCDGVHLGQEDLSRIDSNPEKAVAIIRSIIGKDKLLGLSTHNEDEIKEANALDLNYIGLGAFRDTSTKSVPHVLGDKLDDLAKKSSHHVAAIGGVRLDDHFKHVS
ncbi:MAG: thiamine phosphate synthase, partial [Campylobacterota bacterium]|nr:thiamine phosphate synthase [Campylobacterota bacterium]